MSKAKTAQKVLRVAVRRAQAGKWTRNAFKKKGPDGNFDFCLIGMVTAGHSCALTEAQKGAMILVSQVIIDHFRDRLDKVLSRRGLTLEDLKSTWDDEEQPEEVIARTVIPVFNDYDENLTEEQVVEILKLALIRAETKGLDNEDDSEEDDLPVIDLGDDLLGLLS